MSVENAFILAYMRENLGAWYTRKELATHFGISLIDVADICFELESMGTIAITNPSNGMRVMTAVPIECVLAGSGKPKISEVAGGV